jgi:hypothetical protein
MLSVLVPDAGEKPAGLAGQAMTKRGGLEEGFLCFDRAVVDRKGSLAVEQMVDVGGQSDFALAQKEAAFGQPQLTRRKEARYAACVGVLVGVVIPAL